MVQPQHTVAVNDAAFAAGATPEGIYHLLGNVGEWTASTEACKDDPYRCSVIWDGVTEISQIYIRGGSWKSSKLILPAQSDVANPLLPDNTVGFRCAQHIP